MKPIPLFYTILVFSLLTISCSTNENKDLTKHWKVIKMEKMVKVMSNSYTPIAIEIDDDMYYKFLPYEKVAIKTQMGTEFNGIWSRNDSLISINIDGKVKEFKIMKLTDKELVLVSDRFKFYLEH